MKHCVTSQCAAEIQISGDPSMGELGKKSEVPYYENWSNSILSKNYPLPVLNIPSIEREPSNKTLYHFILVI